MLEKPNQVSFIPFDSSFKARTEQQMKDDLAAEVNAVCSRNTRYTALIDEKEKMLDFVRLVRLRHYKDGYVLTHFILHLFVIF